MFGGIWAIAVSDAHGPGAYFSGEGNKKQMKNIDPSASVTALLMASASPLLAQYALILVAAIFGALVALSRADSPKGSQAIGFMFRAVCFSVFLTGACASWLAPHVGLEVYQLISVVSFGIAVVGDGFFAAKERFIAFLQKGKTDA
jgi:hypothetical protein